MKYYVQKIVDGEVELLPDITATPIFKDWEDVYAPKSVKVIAALYQAVEKRENYFQFHTPTAFGNPDHAMMQGVVIGIEQAEEIEERIVGVRSASRNTARQSWRSIKSRSTGVITMRKRILRRPAGHLACRRSYERNR